VKGSSIFSSWVIVLILLKFITTMFALVNRKKLCKQATLIVVIMISSGQPLGQLEKSNKRSFETFRYD
jgi:hypothetical protein